MATRYKSLLLVVTLVVALFAASPAIQKFLVSAPSPGLTELAIFGPYRNATYPYNVVSGENYTLYLNVTNRLGSCAYYNLETKFRNESQSAPNSFPPFTSSSQPALSSSTFTLADQQTFELPISVSFNYVLDSASNIALQTIVINGASLDGGGTTFAYNAEKGGFFSNLFFELWIYNDSANAFQYNDRYVSLWLNMTAPSS
jgi:hypothetical protein